MRGLYNRRSPSETALTMNVEEFHDFVIDDAARHGHGSGAPHIISRHITAHVVVEVFRCTRADAMPQRHLIHA